MSSTPAPFQATNKESLFSSWKGDVVRVKELYVDGKFRQCAVLCEDLQRAAEHPIHRIVLFFFQAICYESLASAAHDYSSNKIPLLEFARDSYVFAFQASHQPNTSFNQQYAGTPESSPLCATYDILKQYDTPGTASQIDSPCPSNLDFVRWPRSDTDSSAYSVNFPSHSTAIPIPIFDQYSPRGSNDTRTKIKMEVQTPMMKTTPPRKDKVKARLSQTLSVNHIIIEELLPFPLFRNQDKIKSETPCISPKPLPPLPFNHKPQFLKRGHRHILVPRKPAIETLASKFENTPSAFNTPVTPRFIRISQAFSPIHSNPHLNHYLNSASPSRYNDHLSTFRDRLSSHITALNLKIANVAEIQLERKPQTDTRVASFWSFKPIETAGCIAENNMTKKEERIANLKACGWDVKKERHGWKGKEYYEGLRRVAEAELRE